MSAELAPSSALYADESGDDAEGRRQYFNGLEAVDPANGYVERDVAWFEAHILPDFLRTKARLGLGPKLLDVGCGYGYFTRRYAEHFESVLGIDFAENRIETARIRNARANVRYQVVDLLVDEIVPARAFGTDLYDCAVTSAVFQHIPPLARALAAQKVQRALHAGNYLIMYDERLDDRPHAWDGFYEPISPEWVQTDLCGRWELDACELVAVGKHGEKIHRYELHCTW